MVEVFVIECRIDLSVGSSIDLKRLQKVERGCRGGAVEPITLFMLVAVLDFVGHAEVMVLTGSLIDIMRDCTNEL